MANPVGAKTFTDIEIRALIETQQEQFANETQEFRIRKPIEEVVKRSLRQYRDQQENRNQTSNAKVQEVHNRSAQLYGFSTQKPALKGGLLIGQYAAKKAGEKTTAAFLGKCIPGVGLVVGLGSAGYRYYNGDSNLTIAAEVASGFASCIPGLGVAASITIDGCLLAADGYNLKNAISEEIPSDFEYNIENLEEAYGCLGFDWKDGNQEPSQEDVNKMYRDRAAQYHPDKFSQNGEALQKEMDDTFKILNAARDYIKTARKHIKDDEFKDHE